VRNKYKVALLYPVTYVRVVVRGVWVQDDRRHGRADGVREFRDKRESVGTGRETGHHKLVRSYSILLHFESRHEGAVPPLAISQNVLPLGALKVMTPNSRLSIVHCCGDSAAKHQLN